MLDWARLKQLYQQAEERPPAERAAFLQGACGGDAELLREVESLLKAGQMADSFFESAPGPVWEESAAAMAGASLGHYRLDQLLGRGGMGLVYRATDTRLGRTVAIKLLRPEVATAEAQRRFLREARAASALRHPNIVTVHDVGREDGRDFLVMEFVDGQTVAQRLRAGPMPFDEAMNCAIQVAAALEVAHAAGVLHRDLKPQNVMLDSSGAVKVVDFGLAKLPTRQGAAESLETNIGAVIGTAAYMSPEQAAGSSAAAASDLFSLGALLYEMLSGRRAFEGSSTAVTLAAVLRDHPPPLPSPAWSAIARCLEKHPERRFASAGELRAALEDARAGRRGRRVRWTRVATAALMLAAGAGALQWFRHLPPRLRPAQPALSLLQLTADAGLTTEPALSADGRTLAYASDRANGNHLEIWVQPLDGGAARRLTSGTADQHEPEFSPDGSRICYRDEAAGGGVWSVPTAGGEPQLLMRGGRRPRFSPDGKWIACWIGLPGVGDPAAPGSGRMFLIPASGGQAQPFRPDFASARYPLWTPDGKHVLFAGTATDLDTYDWWVADLSGGPAVRTGARRAVEDAGLTNPHDQVLLDPVAWHAETNGILFNTRDLTNLWEAPISSKTFRVSSAVVPITLGTGDEVHPAVAGGRMVFAGLVSRPDIWWLQNGEISPVSESGWAKFTPAISSRGDLVAAIRTEGIIVRDVRSGKDRILPETGNCSWARLTPDGSRVFYTRFEHLHLTLYAQELAAGGTPRRLGQLDAEARVWDISSDGGTVLGMSNSAPRAILSRDRKSGRAMPFLTHPRWSLYWAAFSNDGRQVAFTARTGPDESRIFVAPFDALGGPIVPPDPGSWLPVTDGAANDTAPRWSPDGKTIYYFSDRDGFRCIWSVRLENGYPFSPAVVHHFHAVRRSLSNVPVSMAEMGVSRDRIVFGLTEIWGNIYQAR